MPYGYGISTFPHLSEQLGRAIGNAIAAAAIVADNITQTQMTCISIPRKPIAPQISQKIDVSVCGNFVEMLDYLRADEKIRPAYYARFEVNVCGGFVFILHLDQVDVGMGRP